MLELRYNKITKKVCGWCGDETQFGFLDKAREDEAIVVLDIGVPHGSSQKYLYDEVNEVLIDNPEYIEPPTRRNLATEIDELKTRMGALEPKAV